MQRILQPGDIEALDRTRMPRLRMPEPVVLFTDRAARLRQLAEGNPIADYLHFAAGLVDAQRTALQALPPTDVQALLADPQVVQARAHGMPLLPATAHLPAAWRDVLAAILQAAAGAAQTPAALQPHITRLGGMDAAAQDALARLALEGALPAAEIVLAPLLMAALQVVHTERASRVPESAVPYMEPATVCPLCGSLPVAGVVRIGGEIAGLRFMHCGTCATEWHTVRIKCSHCDTTKGVRYQAIEGGGDVVVAETCEACHTYRKLVNQEKDPLAEPLADELASLTLDLLMGETAFVRASSNPLLVLAPPPQAVEDEEGEEGAA